jgi:hypothetical protein
VSMTVAAVQDCLQGDYIFAGLWDKADDSSTLTLKNCLSQKKDTIFTAGSSFTVDSLSCTSQSMSMLIDGRAIYTLGTNALKNGKKSSFYGTICM